MPDHPLPYLTQPQDHEHPVQTTYQVPGLGELQGWLWPNGVRQFYSIPFGAIEANWSRAVLVDSWPNGKHDGTKIGPWSLQPLPYSFLATHDSTPVKHYSHLNTPDEDDGKNCLGMTVVIPPGDHENLPVMTHIHGGGYFYGSGNLPIYDGFRLVSESVRKGKPVIYASMNYRLGLMGFLASRDIAQDIARNGGKGNGNFALTDQQLGLEWVHRYIGAFGGDNDNVTIFGESCGAVSVHYHLMAKGPAMFQRAIQSSGAASSFRVFTEEEHEALYIRVLNHFGIPLDDPDRLAKLRAIPDRKITASQPEIFQVLEAIPSVCDDGVFFAELPTTTLVTAPPQWLKSFMRGHVRHEGMVMRDEVALEDLSSVEKHLERFLPADGVKQVKEMYGLKGDISEAQKNKIVEEISSDIFVKASDIATARATLAPENKVPCYFYLLEQRTTRPGLYEGEAYHAFDLLFMFLTAYESMSEEERGLADQVHEALVTFASGGDPWEKYQTSQRWCVWGPRGKLNMAKEMDGACDEVFHRVDKMMEQPWYPQLAAFVEELCLKRSRQFEPIVDAKKKSRALAEIPFYTE